MGWVQRAKPRWTHPVGPEVAILSEDAVRLIYRGLRRFRRWFNSDVYRKLYEAHAVFYPGDQTVGPLSTYDLIGRLELSLLRMSGLQPSHTLLDLGCGNGRLAVHAVPYLSAGAYIGTDISQRLLRQADRRVSTSSPKSQARVTWQLQQGQEFAVPEQSIDMICAFSVFTHIEHEDTFRFLQNARRVIRPGGRFVYSCLPLELRVAQDEFREQASHEFGVRWCMVRNVVTTREFMTQIARLAGWETVQWYAGDEANIPDDAGQHHAFGQSSCVLRPI